MGTYTPTPVGTLSNQQAAIATINENFENIADVLSDKLDRVSGLPNHMARDLDMNGNDILNVQAIQFGDGTVIGPGNPWPSGTMDGNVLVTSYKLILPANTESVSLTTPAPSGRVMVYMDGLALVSPEDYSLAADNNTLVFTQTFPQERELIVSYALQASTLEVDAANVTYAPAGTGAMQRTAQTKLREVVSVKDFGAVGDGIADDTAAVQGGIDYVAANGGTLYFPAGTYALNAVLQLLSAADGFCLRGAGRESTTLMRASDYAASVFNISGVSDFTIEHLTVDAKHSVFPNGNHGIAISNGSNIRTQHLVVRDFKNTGILIFENPGDPVTVTYQNNIIDDVLVDGLDASNNGILLGDLRFSGIRNAFVRGMNTAGSPSYGLQLKGKCQYCFIEDSRVENARAGVAFGQETAGPEAVVDSIVSNVTVRNCTWGFYAGLAARNTITGLSIDMNNLGTSAIELVDCVGNVIDARVYKLRDAVGLAAVEFTNVSTDNHVILRTLHMTNTGIRAALFNGSALRNTVRLDRFIGSGAVAYSQQMVVDSSAGGTNIFEMSDRESQAAPTIAAGVITIPHQRISVARVNTEASAATDDLDTITAGIVDGQTVTLKTTSNSRDVVVKHGTGNIRLAGGVDFTLALINARITLQWDSGVNFWCEVSRSNNV